MRAAKDDEGRAQFLAWAFADFRRFAALLDIIDKDGNRGKLALNPIQLHFCANRTGRDIVLKPRQVGFTTLEVARDIFTVVTKPGARVVITCQSITDHGPLKNISTMVRTMFAGLRSSGVRVDLRSESTSEWVLADRDSSLRIMEAGASEAAAEKKGRSGTITRLHLTETAFYEYANETLNALLECVPAASRGSEIVNESTPNGASGRFFEQYQDAASGKSEYTAHFFPWFAQPEYAVALRDGERFVPESERERSVVARFHISPEQLKWFRHKSLEKGEEHTDQEYPTDPATCFLVSGRTFFDRQVTAKLLNAVSKPLSEIDLKASDVDGARAVLGKLQVWSTPLPTESYVVSVDPSEGTGGDPGACVVFTRSGKHVATLHGQFPPWAFGSLCVQVARLYNRALLIVERNNHGHAVIQSAVAGQRYDNVYRSPDGKYGWLTSEVSRSAALDAIEEAHRIGAWASPDERVIKEQRTFTLSDSGKAEAARGAHDDLIMASAIGWDVLRKPVRRINFTNFPHG